MSTETRTQNARGEWVPAIPLPLFIAFGRKQCKCGRKFWTKEGYEGHYALAHVLGLLDRREIMKGSSNRPGSAENTPGPAPKG